MPPNREQLTPNLLWMVQGAAHQFVGQKSESLILERDTGVEPVFWPWEGHVEPIN